MFLHLKMLLFQFWAISIAGQNGAVSSHFSQLMKYDIGKTCKSAPPRGIMTDVCHEY